MTSSSSILLGLDGIVSYLPVAVVIVMAAVFVVVNIGETCSSARRPMEPPWPGHESGMDPIGSARSGSTSASIPRDDLPQVRRRDHLPLPVGGDVLARAGQRRERCSSGGSSSSRRASSPTSTRGRRASSGSTELPDASATETKARRQSPAGLLFGRMSASAAGRGFEAVEHLARLLGGEVERMRSRSDQAAGSTSSRFS